MHTSLRGPLVYASMGTVVLARIHKGVPLCMAIKSKSDMYRILLENFQTKSAFTGEI